MSDNLNKAVEEILAKIIMGETESPTALNYASSDKRVVKATAQLTTLINNEKIASRLEGAIAELERIDGLAYGTEYGRYQEERLYNLYNEQDRIATLKKGEK